MTTRGTVRIRQGSLPAQHDPSYHRARHAPTITEPMAPTRSKHVSFTLQSESSGKSTSESIPETPRDLLITAPLKDGDKKLPLIPLLDISEDLIADAPIEVFTSQDLRQSNREDPASLGVLPSSWACKKSCTCAPRQLLDRLNVTQTADSLNKDRLRSRFSAFVLSPNAEDFLAFTLTKPEASIMQNILDDLAEHGPEETTLRCHRLMQKLAKKSGSLPSSLFLLNVQRISQDPITGGGFADIHLGEYQGTKVAMKILRTHISQVDKEQLHREYCEEALAWRRLRHPRILEFFGIAASVESICFVSPWMKHGNIATFLKSFPQAKPVNLMEQVAEAILFLHSRHFNHGDIKSANILVDDHGDAKLADMGLTTLSVTQAYSSRKSHGGGSARWMAPELFDDDSPRITYESDIYAFGMTLYEVFSGKFPLHELRGEYTIVSRIRAGTRPLKPEASNSLYPISNDVWSISEACWKHTPSMRCKIADVVSMFEGMRIFHVGRRDVFSPYTYHVVIYEGKEYNSVYHLWEAMKYIDRKPVSARRIRQCKKNNDVAQIVKQLGDTVEDGVRPDWDQVMVAKMEEVLLLKFICHPDLVPLLLATGQKEIRYDANSDFFWGHSSTQKSANHIGKCLERIRDRLSAVKQG